VCQIRLRGPVTGEESRSKYIIDLFHNFRHLKNIISQSEGIGVEVEESVCGRVIACHIVGPMNIWMVRRWDTVAGIAHEVISR
jgi:hypothetical protein